MAFVSIFSFSAKECKRLAIKIHFCEALHLINQQSPPGLLLDAGAKSVKVKVNPSGSVCVQETWQVTFPGAAPSQWCPGTVVAAGEVQEQVQGPGTVESKVSGPGGGWCSVLGRTPGVSWRTVHTEELRDSSCQGSPVAFLPQAE